MQQLKVQFQQYKLKYERYFPATFFVAGFVFDIVTLGRIDNLFGIVQQAVYLFLIGIILSYRSLEYAGLFHPTGKMSQLWRYNNEILHFVFGSLLSTYTLFYFVSSSFFVSFGFMLFLFVILLANELPHFQKQGPWLKYLLFGLCLISYFSYIVPIAMGFIGVVPLVLAVILSGIVVYLVFKVLVKKGVPAQNLMKSVLGAPAAIGIIFLLLYFFKFLPPVPLSVQYMGIYHEVARDNGQYVLRYDRPWWLFWQKGDQNFYAQPGDKINCFVRIFSPTGFKDKVFFHWLKKNDFGDWESQDRIANAIVGGREEGFRGFATKSNYSSGKWRVQVETEDGREIGRVYFKVFPQEPNDRQFREDRF